MVDATDPEEEGCIAVVRIDCSDASRTGDAIKRILCEVVSGVLYRAIELRFETWFGGQLTCGNWAEQLSTSGAEVAQDFDLLYFELEAGQLCVDVNSEVEMEVTHKYNAGVVYRNDSDVGTAVAGPLARTQVVLKASRSNERFESRPIVDVWRKAYR